MNTVSTLDPGAIGLLVVAVFAVLIGVGDICFPEYKSKLHKQIWGDIGEGFAEIVYKPKLVRIIGFIEVAVGVFLAVQTLRFGWY